MAAGYCPRCKSRLYPADEESMNAVGVCSYCTTYDTTPDKRLAGKLADYRKAKEEERACCQRQQERRAARNRKARERHWRRTGVSSATVDWMKRTGQL